MSKELRCCRVCLSKKSKKFIPLRSVYRTEHAPQLSYICIFNVATRLSAILDDALPQQLCSNCIDDLLLTFNFMQLAQETDRKLRQFSSSEQRQTRSSIAKLKAGKSEETLSALDSLEGGEQKVKVEFIACCRRDPLEETDNEDDNQCNDEDFSKETIKNESEDDDDKPLKELFKKIKPLQSELKSSVDLVNFSLHGGKTDEDIEYAVDDDISNSATEDIHDFVPSLEAHIFPKGRYKCKQCHNAYFTTAGLKAHNAIHMPNTDKIKKKTQKQNKKKNKSASIDDSSELKRKSPESTMEKNNLDSTEHKIRKEKQPKPKKMFPCHVCGKHMISASKLRYHMVMHTGEKDFLCTMCPKAYSTIYALKHHMRTHTGERPYECKFCGDRFTRPTTLKSHMRRHTGERPYGCDICGKRFIQHSSMTTHMKLNHMAKTIPCPHCDKKYARQTDLTTHLLSHTGDKPFSCQLCPSRFIRQANLNKHMNQHHHPCVKTGRATNKIATGRNKAQSSRKKTKSERTSADPISNIFETHAEIQPNVSSCSSMQSTYQQKASFVPNMCTANLSSNPVITNSSNVIIGNLESSKLLPFSSQPPQVLNQQQVLLNESSNDLVNTARLNRTIEDINRWNWSSTNAT